MSNEGLLQIPVNLDLVHFPGLARIYRRGLISVMGICFCEENPNLGLRQ